MKNTPQAEFKITVNKIGGANVSQMDEVLNLVKILQEQGESPILVLSAFKGITDQLTDALDILDDRNYTKAKINEAFKPALEVIDQKIQEFIKKKENQKKAQEYVKNTFNICIGALIKHKEITTILKPQPNTFEVRDVIIGFGEQSVIGVVEAFLEENHIPALAVPDVSYLETQIPRDKNKPLSHQVLHEKIQAGIAQAIHKVQDQITQKVIILGGFVQDIPDGIINRIGRSYSDATAVDTSAALESLHLPIEKTVFWKDVDGVMTSNPKDLEAEVNTPKKITDVSLSEGLEMASSGSTLLHIDALALADRFKVPLNLKNIKKPAKEGTHYSPTEVKTNLPFKTIYANSDVDTINITIPEMATESGFLEEITRILSKYNLNVNEDLPGGTSITYAIPLPRDDADRKAVRKRIRQASNELRKITVDNEQYNCDVEWGKRNLANISIIGDELKNQDGILGLIASVLGTYHINIIGSVQNISQRKISFYIDHKKAKQAVQMLHGFFIDKNPHIKQELLVSYTNRIDEYTKSD